MNGRSNSRRARKRRREKQKTVFLRARQYRVPTPDFTEPEEIDRRSPEEKPSGDDALAHRLPGSFENGKRR